MNNNPEENDAPIGSEAGATADIPAEGSHKTSRSDELSRLQEENQELQSLIHNLSVHERMFHSLFELSHDAILLLDGDIISDLGAGLIGGLGLVPGANIGEDISIFEAVHGSAPDIAGQNIANPTALLKSAIMMLKYIGAYESAKKIEKALKKVYSDGKILTRDLGGTATTSEFTQAIIDAL